MSKSIERDVTKFKMPDELLLGPDKDGNVFVEEWERELAIWSAGFFGDLAECFTDNKKRSWMIRDAEFVYTVKKRVIDEITGEEKEVEEVKPFPDNKDPSYRSAVRKRDKWEEKQARFEEKGPQIITFLINGTMTKKSRDRLLRVISENKSPILPQIKRDNDVLLLKKHMIGIHDYAGLQVDEKDKLAVEKKFVDLKASKFGSGYTVADHMRVFEEITRQMRTFKLIGNDTQAKDKFRQEELFDAFVKPMETHDNPKIGIRVQNIEDELITVDKSDPEAIYKEFLKMSKLEKKRRGRQAGTQENGYRVCPFSQRRQGEK